MFFYFLLFFCLFPFFLFSINYKFIENNYVFITIISILSIALLYFIILLKKWKYKIKNLKQKNDVLKTDIIEERKEKNTYKTKFDKFNSDEKEKYNEEKKSEITIKDILKKSNQQFWTFDLDGKIISANECYLYDKFYSEEEAIGKNIVDLFGKQAEQFQQITLDSISNNSYAIRRKIEIHNKENILWYNFEWFPVFSNKPKKLINVILSITNLSKQIEMEEIFDIALESSEHSIFIVQYDKILFANNKAIKLSEYDEESLYNISLRKIITNWKPEIDRSDKNGFQILHSTEFITKNNNRLLFNFNQKYIHYQNHYARIIVLNSSSENKELFEKTKNKLTYQQKILDNLKISVALILENKVIAFNLNFAKMFNFSKTHLNNSTWDFIKTEINIFFNDENKELFDDKINNLKITSKSNIIYDYNKTNIKDFKLYTFKDITKLTINNEKQIKELEEAKEACKSKSSYLANMSHEFRTPINGIISITKLLRKTSLSHQQENYINLVDASSNALLDLINDILDMSKIESGYLNLEEIEFNLEDIVKNTLHLLEFKSGNKNIRFISDIDPNIPNILIGDPTRIRQILINLGNNSVKFTEEGEISFSCFIDKCKNKTDNENIYLHFNVSDTGIGIKSDKIDKIFKEFEQEDNSTTRKYGGSGLGLSITKKLIEKMDGNIWVESEYQVGSEFHFIIKIKKNIDAKNDDMELIENTNSLIAVSNKSIEKNITKIFEYYKLNHLIINDFYQLDSFINENNLTHVFIDYKIDNFDFNNLMNYIKLNQNMKFYLLTSLKDEHIYFSNSNLNVIIYPILKNNVLKIFTINPNPEDNEKVEEIIAPKIENQSQSLNILLAEDNIINQNIVKELIESQGHKVNSVSDGYDVLKYLQDSIPDCILMDVNMQELDGISTTKIIREDENNLISNIPIIALTAAVDKETIDNCLNSGMIYYLKKPISLEELNKYLKKINVKDNDNIESERIEKISIEIDVDYLKLTLGNDINIIFKTLSMISNKLPPSIRDIRQAIRNNDSNEIFRIAHSLKGFIGYFQFKKLNNLIIELEKAGKSDNIENANLIWTDLEEELNTFQESIKSTLSKLEENFNKEQN